jgi:hypothetical protein
MQLQVWTSSLNIGKPERRTYCTYEAFQDDLRLDSS